eukprot:gene3818-4772_t
MSKFVVQLLSDEGRATFVVVQASKEDFEIRSASTKEMILSLKTAEIQKARTNAAELGRNTFLALDYLTDSGETARVKLSAPTGTVECLLEILQKTWLSTRLANEASTSDVATENPSEEADESTPTAENTDGRRQRQTISGFAGTENNFSELAVQSDPSKGNSSAARFARAADTVIEGEGKTKAKRNRRAATLFVSNEVERDEHGAALQASNSQRGKVQDLLSMFEAEAKSTAGRLRAKTTVGDGPPPEFTEFGPDTNAAVLRAAFQSGMFRKGAQESLKEVAEGGEDLRRLSREQDSQPVLSPILAAAAQQQAEEGHQSLTQLEAEKLQAEPKPATRWGDVQLVNGAMVDVGSAADSLTGNVLAKKDADFDKLAEKLHDVEERAEIESALTEEQAQKAGLQRRLRQLETAYESDMQELEELRSNLAESRKVAPVAAPAAAEPGPPPLIPRGAPAVVALRAMLAWRLRTFAVQEGPVMAELTASVRALLTQARLEDEIAMRISATSAWQTAADEARDLVERGQTSPGNSDLQASVLMLQQEVERLQANASEGIQQQSATETDPGQDLFRAELEDLRQGSQQQNDLILELRDTMTALQSSLALKQMEAQQQQAVAKQAERRASVSEEALGSLDEVARQQKEMLARAEQHGEMLEAMLAERDEEVSRLQDEGRHREQELQALEQQLQAAQWEQLKTLDREADTQHQEESDLKRLLSQALERIAGLQAELEEKTIQIQHAEAQVQEVEAKAEQAEAKVERVEIEMDALQARLEARERSSEQQQETLVKTELLLQEALRERRVSESDVALSEVESEPERERYRGSIAMGGHPQFDVSEVLSVIEMEEYKALSTRQLETHQTRLQKVEAELQRERQLRLELEARALSESNAAAEQQELAASEVTKELSAEVQDLSRLLDERNAQLMEQAAQLAALQGELRRGGARREAAAASRANVALQAEMGEQIQRLLLARAAQATSPPGDLARCCVEGSHGIRLVLLGGKLNRDCH